MTTTKTYLPLVPASHGVVLPGMVVTLNFETPESLAALAELGMPELAHGDLGRGELGLAGTRSTTDTSTSLPSEVAAEPEVHHDIVIVPRLEHGFATVGTIARVEQVGFMPGGGIAAVVRGIERAHIGAGATTPSGALTVHVDPIAVEPTNPITELLATEYRNTAQRLLDAIGGRAVAGILNEATDPSMLADTIAWLPSLTFEQRVELLETIDVAQRLTLALKWVRTALAEAEVTRDVDTQVHDHFEQQQREAILRKRRDAINKELGEGASSGSTPDYRERLSSLEPVVAVATYEAIEKEINRLDQLGEQSMESGWIRTWLDTVFEIPFAEFTKDNLDLTHARSILDADHTGLKEPKDRIIEFLAIRKLRSDRGVNPTNHRRAGTILVLAGPPGVGKTSLGESVARALGRTFVRTALGGVHDEAEIRGHRRTYVGARPGRIVRALIDAKSMNPVVLLDEVDKLGNDYRGDPTAALLEVLDPAQNHTFRDHYLELQLDLSSVVFIATANTLDRIPAPLLDRMEVITISGYSEDEKLAIARDHLLPRVIERNGLEDGEVVVNEEVLRAIVSGYTREAGVRRLEQRLDRLVRKAATRLAMEEATSPIIVRVEELREILGRPVVDERPSDRITGPGVATGLAVTGAGGDVLYVEAAAMRGTPGVKLTGQLGDVMRESGEIALSYLRSHAAELGIDPDALDREFHVHFPAGAIPKDGPSAGVTMTTALVSLLTHRAVRSDVAMTGEVTLQGRVLPIGGVKEKVLAAHRSGVRHVVLPEGNRHDAEDVPDNVREHITIHFATTIADVLAVAFAPDQQLAA